MKYSAVAVLVGLVVGCSPPASITPLPPGHPVAPSQSPLTEVQAISASKAALFGSGGDPGFPQSSGTAPCILTGGGPPLGGRYAAACEVLAVPGSAGYWTVTFTERWALSVSSASRRTHSWTFAVEPNGRAILVGDHGDPLPISYD